MSDVPLPPDPPEDADTALAGEYVLRLLGPEEAAACAAREARDPVFAARVAAWRADFEALDAAYAAEAPPAGLERRITERLFGAPAAPAGGLWRSLGLWRGVAAAAVLAAIWFAGVGRPPAPGPGEAPARLVSALASQDDSGVALVAVYEPQASVLNLSRTAGGPAPGRALQLWLVEGGAAPVSLGMLPDGPLARVVVPRALAGRIGPGSALAVSEEPPGGSATPTRVVAVGEVSEI